MSQIVCDNLVKIYKVADLEVVALQGLDLAVEQGEFIAVVGASGSGKSTLQNILGGMDVPTAGKAEVAGFDLTSLTPKERTIYRRSIVAWQQTTRTSSVPQRRGERRAAADPRGAARRRPARVCASSSCGSWAWARAATSRPALGRRAAARRHCDRPRQPPASCSRTSPRRLDTETAVEIFATCAVRTVSSA